jgi:hypothetical protein
MGSIGWKTTAAASLRAGVGIFACVLCFGHLVMLLWLFPWLIRGRTNVRVDLGPPMR